MIPQPSQYVIIVLHNGVRLDGNVLEWGDQITLVSKSKSITTVIPDLSDVLYYQIVQTEAQYEAAKTKPIKTPEDIKAIADMKVELNNIEKEQLARKFSTHEISGNPGLTHYDIPSFAKIPIVTQYPTKKAGREHSSADESLQGLFRKK